MNLIGQEFEKQKDPKTWAKVGGSDMCGHMDTLRQLASECRHVTEFGVRRVVSTWAFLHGCRGKIVSYDVARTPEMIRAEKMCREAGVDWTCHQANVNQVRIEPTEMLFIDTVHTYAQLTRELTRHSDKVGKYIVLHDTTTFGETGEDRNQPGLWQAVEDLVAKGVWRVRDRYTNCNGLTVLERI